MLWGTDIMWRFYVSEQSNVPSQNARVSSTHIDDLLTHDLEKEMFLVPEQVVKPGAVVWLYLRLSALSQHFH